MFCYRHVSYITLVPQFDRRYPPRLDEEIRNEQTASHLSYARFGREKPPTLRSFGKEIIRETTSLS